MKLRKLSIAFPVLLGGCASLGLAVYDSEEVYLQRLQDTEVVVESVSDFDFTPTQLKKNIEYELGKEGSANAFNFGAGKAFYQGFRVPNDTADTVTLTTFSNFSNIAQKYAHIVYPTFVEYDADFNLLTQTIPKIQQVEDMRGTRFKAAFPLRVETVFLVVYADPRMVGDTVDWEFTFASAGIVTAFAQSDEAASLGAGGPLTIRFD